MEKIRDFEIDTEALSDLIEVCWICKNRKNCPLDWECETLENLDHDNPYLRDE